MTSKKIFKNFGALVFGVCAAILLAEFISLAWVKIRTGESFYSMPLPKEDESNVANNKIPNLIHPYFGMVRNSHRSVKAIVFPDRIKTMVDAESAYPDWINLKPNNHGFWSEVDYPYNKTKNDYIVGIFGGSVAQWLAVQGKEYLEKKLTELPGLEDKKIIVLNFASGGYKQPQQLLALSYFVSLGQKFDLVINLDGFNEVALPFSANLPRNISVSLPRKYPGGLAALTSIASPQTVAWLNDIYTLERRIDRLSKWSQQRVSAFAHIVTSRIALLFKGIRLKRLDNSPKNTSEDSAFFVLKPSFDAGDVDAAKEEMIRIWKNASIAMHSITNQVGARYVHILQPNQYFSEKKFSSSELDIAIDENHGYGKAVKLFYPALLAGSKSLSKSGVNFLDFTGIFDEEAKPTFSDSCCHYNTLGNNLLIDNLIKRL
jgi:hypothetical protein